MKVSALNSHTSNHDSYSCKENEGKNQELTKNEPHCNVVRPIIATVPKTGTNLLFSFLKNLKVEYLPNCKQGKGFSYHLLTLMFQYSIGNKTQTECFEKDKKYIITYRDPRDTLISLRNWIGSEGDLKIREQLYGRSEEYIRQAQASRNMPMDQWLDGMLRTGAQQSIETLRRQQAIYMIHPIQQLGLQNVLLLRFEDMVGPEYGGSSREIQFETFKKVAIFVGKYINDDQIRETIASSVGAKTLTLTKVKKKVGQWRKHFKPRHINAFNQKHETLLKELGYE